MSAAKIKNVKRTFFMDLLLEIFYPKSAVGKTYPGDSRWLLRLNRKPSAKPMTFFFLNWFYYFSLLFLLLPCLFDHLIRAEKHRLWNREADLFGCLEIDHKLEFCRLFYW